jgi:hypothetical protein
LLSGLEIGYTSHQLNYQLILDTQSQRKYFSLYVGRSQMPRGRSKKQPAEVELLPPDENDQIKVRQVKHKTEWVELHPVEETSEEGEELDDGPTEDKPQRKVKDEHKKLRELLAQHNIAPSAQLRLSIERYLHSESSEGGTWSEKEFLTRYICTKEQIVNEDYLDVARKWGAGTYWFTLRMYTPGKSPGSRVVASWEKRLGAVPSSPVIQSVNPADPNSPQFVIQTNGDGQQAYQPPSMRDIMKAQKEAFKEQLEMAKLMREAYGFNSEPSQQEPKSEEEIIAGAIIKQPAVIESVVESIIKRVGVKGGDSDTPWWADILKDSITTGQLAPTVQGVVKALFPNGLFGGLFPGGQNNGQAPMATPPLQTNGPADSQRAPDGRTVVAQEIPQGNQSLQSTNGEVDQQGGMLPAGQQQITPEQHALSRLIQNCQRNVPVQVAYQQLVSYADAIEDQAPDFSIYGYIDLLGSMPTDQVLEFVKSLPGGEQIIALPHAKEWTTELQQLIKESQEGEEE